MGAEIKVDDLFSGLSGIKKTAFLRGFFKRKIYGCLLKLKTPAACLLVPSKVPTL